MEASSTKLEAPKPLTFTIEGGLKKTEFNADELRHFVQSTDQPAFVATDDKGNESIILVEPLRALFSE
jgi:hypothetical protein